MPGMKTTQQMRDELLLAGGGQPKASPKVSPMGFYSPLEEAALKIQRKTGNAQAFMNDLRTVPKEHLQHAGVDKLLTSRPTLTREEVQQHISQAAPRVDVVVKKARDTWRDRFDLLMTRGYRNLTPEEQAEFRALDERWDREGPSPDPEESDTKYNQYQLPGGENYREMLLTLPERSDADRALREFQNRMMDKYPGAGIMWRREATPSEVAEHDRLKAAWSRENAAPSYRSSHWDEPNVLAHIRMNDRTDKDGKKVLFVEEIQSDWGQEGKKKGFGNADGLKPGYSITQLDDGRWQLNQQGRSVPVARNDTQEGLMYYARQAGLADLSPGVPSAPFVTKTNDWVNLALKHVLKTAAQEGHDRVAFVKGEQAADRFGLDKHFSRVAARPTSTGGYQLQTIMKDGRREDSIDVPPDKLHQYVGQDLADKIHSQRGGVFEGGDLRMPQTGMRKFYDELVPAQAQGLIKRFGGQMGTVQVPLEDGVSEHPGFDITPEMRQAILKPMSYKVGGAVPMMDAMRLKVWDKRKGR